jgi:hypothetical protein
MTTITGGTTLTGEPAGMRYPVPSDEQFFDVMYDPGEFTEAPDLARIGSALIAAHEARFSHLQTRTVVCLWKRTGGKTKGKAMLGKVVKPSGLLRYFADKADGSAVDVVLWLAADHCRDKRLTHRQVEALVHHELLHTGEDDAGNLILVGPDFVGFSAEISEYGLWDESLAEMAGAVQGRLFNEGHAPLAVGA